MINNLKLHFKLARQHKKFLKEFNLLQLIKHFIKCSNKVFAVVNLEYLKV